MKKKSFDYKWLVGGIAGLGIISGAIVGAARYIMLPESLAATNQKVDKLEDAVTSISQSIASQQIYNKAVQDILSNSPPNAKKEEVIYSPDKKFFWDESEKNWRSVKEFHENH